MAAMLAVIVLVLGVCADHTHGFVLSNLFKSSVCYGDLGCFSTNYPFRSYTRPVALLPDSPEKINTKFYLNTRMNPTRVSRQQIKLSRDLLDHSHFDGNKKTKIIVHGFLQNAFRPWIRDLVDELLINEDVNIISVDWSAGSSTMYIQASANTRVVGAMVAQLIHFLLNNTNTTARDVHIIGHSLGAHAAGYAGNRTQGLGRITGLDPAEPYFQHTEPEVRLDPSDAIFVDAIHSDASSILKLGFGMMQAVGHLDVYPNGGYNQPGCDSQRSSKLAGDIWEAVRSFKYNDVFTLIQEVAQEEEGVTCNHLFACRLYITSINSACPFTAYPCSSYDHFNKGQCLNCNHTNCSVLGYHASPEQGSGIMYLDTEEQFPFCNRHYLINVTISETQNVIKGKVKLSIQGDEGSIRNISMTKGSQIIMPGESLSLLHHNTTNVGNITSVTLSYERTGTYFTRWLYATAINIDRVDILVGETQKMYSFCAKQEWRVPSLTAVTFDVQC